MKISKLLLRNYKKFVQQEINFCNEDGQPNDMVLLVGKNGSGKSSVLQAISMLLGSAVKPHTKPSDLDYPGFRWDNIQRGTMPVHIEATLQFSGDEISAVQTFAHELSKLYPNQKYGPVSAEKEVKLHLDYLNNKILGDTLKKFNLTQGYQYALLLSKFQQNFDQLFKQIGSFYIYHEQRTASSIDASRLIGDSSVEGEKTQLVNEKLVKDVLFKWYIFHNNVVAQKFSLREGQRDLFAELEKKFNLLFKEKSFKGFAPKMSPENFFDSEQDFWLFDGVNDYEFSEMSGGERAIFPLLIDFANRNINNSIIIIDEVELHLHPPLQQAFVRALPLLGSNNQFILTTHSDDVAALFNDDQIIRLD